MNDDPLAAPASSAPAPGLKPLAIAAFALPFSSYVSEQANATASRIMAEGPPDVAGIEGLREHYGKWNDARVEEMRPNFPVDIEERVIGGVKVHWVTPKNGVAQSNRERILINLHGGGFMWGSGSGALVETIPIAAVGRITVVTVDYRLAPEHRFPAASEDVACVYAELIKSYRPENIGIFGGSAGGILTSQMIPWFRDHGLPAPGAIATLCGTGEVLGGDSLFLAAVGCGQPAPPPEAAGPGPLPVSYMDGVALDNPLGYPLASEDLLRHFPPTLLLAGSRDFATSMMTRVHRKLAAVDVHAELYLFDGLWHGFFVFPDLPESREAYQIIVKFFARQLGKPASRG